MEWEYKSTMAGIEMNAPEFTSQIIGASPSWEKETFLGIEYKKCVTKVVVYVVADDPSGVSYIYAKAKPGRLFGGDSQSKTLPGDTYSYTFTFDSLFDTVISNILTGWTVDVSAMDNNGNGDGFTYHIDSLVQTLWNQVQTELQNLIDATKPWLRDRVKELLRGPITLLMIIASQPTNKESDLAQAMLGYIYSISKGINECTHKELLEIIAGITCLNGDMLSYVVNEIFSCFDYFIDLINIVTEGLISIVRELIEENYAILNYNGDAHYRKINVKDNAFISSLDHINYNDRFNNFVDPFGFDTISTEITGSGNIIYPVLGNPVIASLESESTRTFTMYVKTTQTENWVVSIQNSFNPAITKELTISQIYKDSVSDSYYTDALLPSSTPVGLYDLKITLLLQI